MCQEGWVQGQVQDWYGRRCVRVQAGRRSFSLWGPPRPRVQALLRAQASLTNAVEWAVPPRSLGGCGKTLWQEGADCYDLGTWYAAARL